MARIVLIKLGRLDNSSANHPAPADDSDTTILKFLEQCGIAFVTSEPPYEISGGTPYFARTAAAANGFDVYSKLEPDGGSPSGHSTDSLLWKQQEVYKSIISRASSHNGSSGKPVQIAGDSVINKPLLISPKEFGLVHYNNDGNILRREFGLVKEAWPHTSEKPEPVPQAFRRIFERIKRSFPEEIDKDILDKSGIINAKPDFNFVPLGGKPVGFVTGNYPDHSGKLAFEFFDKVSERLDVKLNLTTDTAVHFTHEVSELASIKHGATGDIPGSYPDLLDSLAVGEGTGRLLNCGLQAPRPLGHFGISALSDNLAVA